MSVKIEPLHLNTNIRDWFERYSFLCTAVSVEGEELTDEKVLANFIARCDAQVYKTIKSLVSPDEVNTKTFEHLNLQSLRWGISFTNFPKNQGSRLLVLSQSYVRLEKSANIMIIRRSIVRSFSSWTSGFISSVRSTREGGANIHRCGQRGAV